MVSHTITGLKRWSCGPRDLPAVADIKAIHVYDFDNTLFKTPMPNQKLWTISTIGFLQNQDGLAYGGWWQDQRILEATGEGVEKEERVAWRGWWNEQIVSLVKLSMEQPDALTVLLTGRGEKNFANIITRMAASKKLDFDLICLKPKAGPNNQIFGSTMKYKQALLSDLVHTYKDADEIRVYEDRTSQIKGFREFFGNFNRMTLSPLAAIPRKQIAAEVIHVAENIDNLDPVIETSEVQKMINDHNTAVRAGTTSISRSFKIKKNVLFTAYLISPIDTAKLFSLINLPPAIAESGVVILANTILITLGTCPAPVLDKIGGMGHKQTWQITSMGVYDLKIWAARVVPIPSNSAIHTDNSVGTIVVLAHLKNARTVDANRIKNWQPINTEHQYVFETEIGERAQLSIDREGDKEGDDESQLQDRNPKKRHLDTGQPQMERDVYPRLAQGSSQHQRGPGYVNEENRRSGAGGHGGNYRGGNQNRGRGGGGGGSGSGNNGGRFPPHAGARGGRGGGGGNRSGGGNRGRARGGYKSLDDVGGSGSGRYGGQNGGGYQNSQLPNYDDGPSHGGEAYNAAFPALGGGGRDHNGNNGSGGLPYGK